MCKNFSPRPTRREMLRGAVGGFGALALHAMLAEEQTAAAANASAGVDPLAPKPTHFPPGPSASSFCT